MPSVLDKVLTNGELCGMENDSLLQEIARYCAEAGISPSSLGLWALGNSRFVEREQRRVVKSQEDAAKLRAYMAAHPADQRKKPSAA